MRLLEKQELIYVQLVLFLDNKTQFKALDVSNVISEKLGNIFPQDPNILNNPAMQNNPYVKNMPRINYATDKYILNITPAKIEFIFNNKTRSSDYKNELLDIFKTLITVVNQDLQFVIHRLGVITNYAIPAMNDMNFSLNSQTIVENDEGFQELNFAWLEKIFINGIPINKWVRFIRNLNNKNNDFVSIDINTLTEVDLHYLKSDLYYTINEILKHIEDKI